jgi:hypothetical protein
MKGVDLKASLVVVEKRKNPIPSPEFEPKLLPCPTCSYILTHFSARLTHRPDDGGSKHL